MQSIQKLLMFAAFPAAAVVVGAVIASIRTPGPSVRSAIQHFAAGVVFAALATELLPEIMHRRLPWVTITGFALGVLVMLGIKAMTEVPSEPSKDGKNVKVVPLSLLVILGVDIALDGVLVGVGFAAGEKQGLLLTIALTLEVLFLGMSGASTLRGNGASLVKAITVSLGMAGLLMAGATLGAMLLNGLSVAALDGVLAFGLAALLYLVTEELLVEAHEAPETPLLTATFFIGFLLLIVIEMFV